MNNLFNAIRGAFDSLWQIRPRGKSFEIITPFPAARDKYVSVFIVRQDGKIIVTDGGWLNDGIYLIGADAPDLTSLFDKILNYYINDFGVLRTRGTNNRIIYFKAIADPEFVPNIVFEMANFVSLVSSTALAPLREEREARNTFSRRTTEFIRNRVEAGRFESNAILTDKAPSAKFNAIVRTKTDRPILINFVTGSTSAYMIQSYCKSNTMFDLLKQADADANVKDRIVVMDDNAKGFKYEDLSPFFEMSRAKQQRPIMWSTEEMQFAQLLN